MTLGWKLPRFSGGSPVLGYYIDKREAHHRNWHEVNSSPIKKRIYTVGIILFPADSAAIFTIYLHLKKFYIFGETLSEVYFP